MQATTAAAPCPQRRRWRCASGDVGAARAAASAAPCKPRRRRRRSANSGDVGDALPVATATA
eukprot:1980344-Pleurochrysis_carterae.AAC.1